MRTILLGVTVSESLAFFGPLQELLEAEGWLVHVVCDSGDGTVTTPPANGGNHIIPMKRRPSVLSDLRSLLRWTVLLWKIKPEAIFVATPKAGFLGMLAARMTGIHHRVYGLWGLRMETAAGITKRLLVKVEKLTAAFSTKILVASPSLRQKYISLGLSAESKLIVPGHGSTHGVNISRFVPWNLDLILRKRTELCLDPNLPVLGFVGRFSSDKGAKTILETSKYLRKIGVLHQVLLVGPIEDSPEVLEQISFESTALISTGAVDDVQNYFPIMDILLLPTLREGFPNVVLEAASCGVPTITSDATGAIDSVVDGVTGRVVEVGQPNKFAETTAELLSRPSERAALGRAARKRAVSHFREEYVVREVFEHLTRALQD